MADQLSEECLSQLEAEIISDLLEAAILAEELFDYYELEEYAKKLHH